MSTEAAVARPVSLKMMTLSMSSGLASADLQQPSPITTPPPVTTERMADVPTSLTVEKYKGSIKGFLDGKELLQKAPAGSGTTLVAKPRVPFSKSLRNRLQLPDVTSVTSSTSLNVHRPAVVGHRGALYEQLENTRESFLQCVAWGCEAVELDVFLLKDGNLVVFHGAGNDRNPGQLDGYCLNSNKNEQQLLPRSTILDLDLTAARQLVFNSAYNEFPCPPDRVAAGQIPTLEQVLLDLKPTKTQVKIELKGPNTVFPVLELVERLDMVDHCQYSSFDLSRLAELRLLRPNAQRYRTGALFDDLPDNYLQQASAVGATEVHLRYDTCTVQRCQEIHSAGMQSMAWLRGPAGMLEDTQTKFWDVGNEDAACYQALIETGVQQICCNRPDLLVQLLQQQDKQQIQLQQGATAAGIV